MFELYGSYDRRCVIVQRELNEILDYLSYVNTPRKGTDLETHRVFSGLAGFLSTVIGYRVYVPPRSGIRETPPILIQDDRRCDIPNDTCGWSARRKHSGRHALVQQLL